jgi:hypothetical protein
MPFCAPANLVSNKRGAQRNYGHHVWVAHQNAGEQKHIDFIVFVLGHRNSGCLTRARQK